MSALLLLGCDLGPRVDEPSEGPPLHLVASDPADGAGLDCALVGGECGVPTDVSVVLRFDRFLLPDTATRQSIRFYTGDPGQPVPPPSNARPELTPQYDVAERSVRYVLPPGVRLEPHTLYTLELLTYTTEQPYGFRAFDGAPLGSDSARRLSFRTGGAPLAAPSEPAPSCEDFLLTISGCASGGCHADRSDLSAPSMGLSLASAAGLRATAVSRPAHQTEIGDTTGVAMQDAVRFGANMPIFDPGRPENSYLMYKLLVAPEAYVPDADAVDATGGCPAGHWCEAPDSAELDRLRSWFVLGAPMPFVDPSLRFIHHASLTQIEDFIARGDACGEAE